DDMATRHGVVVAVVAVIDLESQVLEPGGRLVGVLPAQVRDVDRLGSLAQHHGDSSVAPLLGSGLRIGTQHLALGHLLRIAALGLAEDEMAGLQPLSRLSEALAPQLGDAVPLGAPGYHDADSVAL